jgi:hypothetical protein
MAAMRWAVPALAALSVAGCGLRVPEIQENPTVPKDGQLLVHAIVGSVHCEVIKALKWANENGPKPVVKRVAKADMPAIMPPPPSILTLGTKHKRKKKDVANTVFPGWGVQIALTLTMEEKTGFSPSVVYLPHTPITSVFTLGGGLTQSADATRTDKMSFYYLVEDLLNHPECSPGIQEGNDRSLLVQNDLKLTEWLQDYLMVVATQDVQEPGAKSGILKSNVLSHDVKFEVLSSGNVTPAWKLSNATVDQTGSLFSTSRDRTHDLLITLGPGDSTGFTGAAQGADLAQQITNGITTGLKNRPR